MYHILCSGYKYAHVQCPDGKVQLMPIEKAVNLIWLQDGVVL